MRREPTATACDDLLGLATPVVKSIDLLQEIPPVAQQRYSSSLGW
jgi:hypothetical protein